MRATTTRGALQPSPQPLTVTAAGAATLLGWWTRRDGEVVPNGERVRSLYRSGKFPAPVDPTLGARSWFWSRRVVELYADGTWTEVAA
jgi:hypothetical protein